MVDITTPENISKNFQKNRNFSEFTTLGTGGLIKYFIDVEDEETLINTIKFAINNNIKFLVVGGCSNLLVSDEGVEYLVIKNSIKGLKIENQIVIIKSGNRLQDLVDFTVKEGLSGAQKLSGIPGTVGGAIYGNAGAYGQTISDCLVEVICFDGKNKVILKKEECNFLYRDSAFKKNGLIILEAKFSFSFDNPEKLKKEADEIWNTRLVKFPPSLKCPGSFFKNVIADNVSNEIIKHIPQEKIIYGKIPAGALLEEVGAKGQRLGNIQISSNHANLFINLGGGKTSDFYKIALIYKQRVKERFSVELEPEVQLINLPPF